MRRPDVVHPTLAELPCGPALVGEAGFPSAGPVVRQLKRHLHEAVGAQLEGAHVRLCKVPEGEHLQVGVVAQSEMRQS